MDEYSTLVGLRNGHLELWANDPHPDISGSEGIRRYQVFDREHTQTVEGIAVNGLHIVTGSADKTIRGRVFIQSPLPYV